MTDRRPLASVIIPVLDDTPALAAALGSLERDARVEVIVVNGGRCDTGLIALEAARTDVTWLVSPAGRGRQMNAGARRARGRWVLFLHADTQLPVGWCDELERFDADATVGGGSFRFRLDSSSSWARVIERGVAWRVRWLGLPFGDQGLFARRDLFESLGGFRELALMEDVDFVRRLGKKSHLRHSRLTVVTSARRWQTEGWCRHSLKNLWLQVLFLLGASPDWLARYYWSDRARAHDAGRDTSVVRDA